MFSTCVLSAFQSLPIPSSCVAKTGETPQTNPLPPPVLKPTNQQKGASGLCPPLTFPADISTPPCRHPQNSLPLLRQTAHPVPGGHFQRPLVPTGGPRACPNCPQGPGPRTSRPLPPAIQVRPTPSRSTNPRFHTLPGPVLPKAPAGCGALPSEVSEHGKRLRGAPGGSSARARLGRRAPTWPWERSRGGTGPRRPLRAGGWRGKKTGLGREPLTSLGATVTPPDRKSVV